MQIKEIRQYNQKQQKRYAAKTGIVVDIQNIGKNTKPIAVKAKKSLEEIHPGVFLSTEVLEFPDGNFSNVYNLFWNNRKAYLTSEIHSEQKPYYLLDYMEKDPSILAVINGAFFFLIDVVDREPKDYPYHLCIRNGKVVGLPSHDAAIVYTEKEKMHAKEPKATGTIAINGKILTWFGSETKRPAHSTKNVTLYNSGSSKLIKVFDKKTGVRMGMLDHKHIHTPKKLRAVDLIINNDKEGNLIITDIKKGGGSHYFDGLFILHMDASMNTFKVGDHVNPLTLDGLNLQDISSGLTINKSVKDPYFFVPERINSRDARSVIARDVTGNIHFIVFDGSKYIPNFRGVSANDVSSYFSEDKYKWAYFLDGGSSSRIIVKDGDKRRFFANEFAFKKITNETFLWDWKRHRKLASSIVLKIKK